MKRGDPVLPAGGPSIAPDVLEQDELAARTEDAASFGKDGLRVINGAEDESRYGRVEALVGERELLRTRGHDLHGHLCFLEAVREPLRHARVRLDRDDPASAFVVREARTGASPDLDDIALEAGEEVVAALSDPGALCARSKEVVDPADHGWASSTRRPSPPP